MTASASSSKLSLSSLNYRQTGLLTAGIAIDGISWLEAPAPVVSLVEDMLNFSRTIPQTSPLVRLFQSFLYDRSSRTDTIFLVHLMGSRLAYMQHEV
jgi:hypothetical protein